MSITTTITNWLVVWNICYFFHIRYIFQRGWNHQPAKIGIIINHYQALSPVFFHIATEDGPFIDDLPIKNGDFPVRYFGRGATKTDTKLLVTNQKIYSYYIEYSLLYCMIIGISPMKHVYIYRSITLFHYCYLTIIPLLLYKFYWRWNSHIDIRYNSISYTSIITSYIHSINVNYSLRVYSPWNTHTYTYMGISLLFHYT